MRSLISSPFNDLFFGPELARTHRPAVDVLEQADHYQVKVDVPGVAKDDIALEVQNGV